MGELKGDANETEPVDVQAKKINELKQQALKDGDTWYGFGTKTIVSMIWCWRSWYIVVSNTASWQIQAKLIKHKSVIVTQLLQEWVQ